MKHENNMSKTLPSRDLVPANETTGDMASWTLSIPAQLKRTGMEKKMLIDRVSTDKAKPDANLIKLVVKAFSLKDKFIHNDGKDIKTIADGENMTGSYFTRLIRFNFLAPDIIQAILLGYQPLTLDAATLLRYSSKLPLDWKEQRAVLGFK